MPKLTYLGNHFLPIMAHSDMPILANSALLFYRAIDVPFLAKTLIDLEENVVLRMGV